MQYNKQTNEQKINEINIKIVSSQQERDKYNKQVKKINQQINDEQRDVELLKLWLQGQLPMAAIILVVSLLAGGISPGLTIGGVFVALQAGTSIVAATSKSKKEKHIAELELDKSEAEYHSDECQKQIDASRVLITNLKNPDYELQQAAIKSQEESNYEIFKIVDGQAIKMDNPIQYTKKRNR